MDCGQISKIEIWVKIFETKSWPIIVSQVMVCYKIQRSMLLQSQGNVWCLLSGFKMLMISLWTKATSHIWCDCGKEFQIWMHVCEHVFVHYTYISSKFLSGIDWKLRKLCVFKVLANLSKIIRTILIFINFSYLYYSNLAPKMSILPFQTHYK